MEHRHESGGFKTNVAMGLLIKMDYSYHAEIISQETHMKQTQQMLESRLLRMSQMKKIWVQNDVI